MNNWNILRNAYDWRDQQLQQNGFLDLYGNGIGQSNPLKREAKELKKKIKNIPVMNKNYLMELYRNKEYDNFIRHANYALDDYFQTSSSLSEEGSGGCKSCNTCQCEGGAKKKPYCGVADKIPKGFKKGSMLECAEKNQVRLYGLNKIDKRTLQKAKAEKKPPKTKLLTQIGSLSGKMNKLKKDIPYEKDKKKKGQLQADLKKIQAEYKQVTELYRKHY